MHPDLPLNQILIGDCRELLKTLPDESVHCIVTSPPYWGLRSYGTDPQVWTNGHEPCIEHQWTTETRNGQSGGKSDKQDSNRGSRFNNLKVDTCSVCGAWRGELGLEPTPELYVAHLVEIFRECRRVLRDDGTLWLNLGDSYSSSPCGNAGKHPLRQNPSALRSQRMDTSHIPGLKPKDLVGIPWMVAFALRADGWYLRSDIIWAKPNPMPESVTDRPTKSHEYIFLLSKSQKYYYDADAIAEPSNGWNGSKFDDERDLLIRPNTGRGPRNIKGNMSERGVTRTTEGLNLKTSAEKTHETRNRRTVWTVATHPYRQAHFATYPPKLIEPCILAGTSARGVCSKCGAPWERVIERHVPKLGIDIPVAQRHKNEGSARAHSETSAIRVSHSGNWSRWKAEHPNETTGWRPTCDCDAGEPVPAVVLDPFMGSGTTASVCVSLKRDYIGFDLNPAYVEDIAQDRADNTPPPLFVM